MNTDQWQPAPGRVYAPAVPRIAGTPRVAVVGGSLTGPVLALLLLHAGHPRVAVYEATPAAAPQGGGLIALEHPALDILDRLGIDQDEYVTGGSQHIVQASVHRRLPSGAVRRTFPGRFTTWTRLHAALVRRLPADALRTGVRVTDLTDHAGTPRLGLAGRDGDSADLVVFADGRSSTGRRQLDPGRVLRYAGYVAHRGTTPLHVGGSDDFLRLEPGASQFNIAPIPGGCDWLFYLDATTDLYTAHFGAPPHRRLFAHPAHVSQAARTFVDEHAIALLPAEAAATVHATATRMAAPVMDIDPPTRMVWPIGRGHAVLLGDALAPVRPHTGRGANNGIEQAAALVAALTQHRRHGADLTGALHGWQRRQLPTVTAALRLGAVIGARLGLGRPAGNPVPTRELVGAHR